MKNEPEGCHHQWIARGPLASVQHCVDCGCVSIHMGATTVRMDAQSLSHLWQTLGDALRTLKSSDPSPSTWAWAPKKISAQS